MNAALRWLCVTFFFALVTLPAAAQVTKRSHRMDRELFLSYDNDLVFMTDQYYTSGANVIYSRLLHPESRFYHFFKSRRSDDSKVIIQYNYGHKIFTPHDIKKRDVEDFDRPYAGWHYLKFKVRNFSSVNTMNKFQLEVGLVGDASGIGQFQTWWHGSFGIVHPRGWQYQISNEPVLNIAYTKMKSWKLFKPVDIVTDAGAKFGNGQNKLMQDVTMRLGKFNRLINSGYAESRMSSILPTVGNKDPEEEEAFLFYGVTAEQVASNIFIEGSLLGTSSPHTEKAKDFVIIRRWGFMYTNYYTTFYFTFYRISPEVVGGRVHRYINLNLAFRF